MLVVLPLSEKVYKMRGFWLWLLIWEEGESTFLLLVGEGGGSVCILREGGWDGRGLLIVWVSIDPWLPSSYNRSTSLFVPSSTFCILWPHGDIFARLQSSLNNPVIY